MSETTSPRRMAAEVLFNVATILELSEVHPRRVQAYRRAARRLLTGAPVALADLSGLGPMVQRRIVKIALDGKP